MAFPRVTLVPLVFNLASVAVASQQNSQRPRGSFQPERSHPSCGGNAYSDDIRNDVLTSHRLGIPLDSPELNLLRAQPPAYPSLQTCMNYINRERELGHARAMHATGNRVAERKIEGEPLVRLALYRLACPSRGADRSCTGIPLQYGHECCPVFSYCRCRGREASQSHYEKVIYDM